MVASGIVGMLVAGILSLIFQKLLLCYSDKLGLMDVPNRRSMHQSSKSRAGGIAIFGAFAIGLLVARVDLPWLLILAFCIVFFLGLYDDMRCSSSKTKLLWLATAAGVLFLGDFGIYFLGKFWGVQLFLPPFIAFILMLFAVVGFVNAMNLIDGLDGLAASVGIIMLGAFLYIGYRFSDPLIFTASLILIGSLVGFLVFNWHPSKIFMGDTGSLSLGFTIAVLAIHSINQEYITPVSVLLLTAVPILDTLIVMIRRIVNKQNPFHADKTHIHHILLKQHYANVPKTVRILVLLQAVFTYIGLGFKARDDVLTLIVFGLLFVLFYTMLTPTKPYKKKYKQKGGYSFFRKKTDT